MALLASLTIVAAACGDDSKDTAATTAESAAVETTTGDTAAPDTTTAVTTGDTATPDTTGGETDYMWTPNADVLAGAEGQVNIVAWAGYAEDGSTDPAYDWVTPFEEITSCSVNVKTGACLLYTSPSPRDRTRSRMPSSA